MLMSVFELINYVPTYDKYILQYYGGYHDFMVIFIHTKSMLCIYLEFIKIDRLWVLN